jgi:hypothetical protein
MFRQLGAGAYQAHIPQKHIEHLGQLIKLPAAQQGTYRSEHLVTGRRDRMMRFVRDVNHGSELQNGKDMAVTAYALLQEENRTRRCQPHRQGDHQQDRNQQRQHRQNAGAIEDTLGARPRPATQRLSAQKVRESNCRNKAVSRLQSVDLIGIATGVVLRGATHGLVFKSFSDNRICAQLGLRKAKSSIPLNISGMKRALRRLCGNRSDRLARFLTFAICEKQSPFFAA